LYCRGQEVVVENNNIVGRDGEGDFRLSGNDVAEQFVDEFALGVIVSVTVAAVYANILSALYGIHVFRFLQTQTPSTRVTPGTPEVRNKKNTWVGIKLFLFLVISKEKVYFALSNYL